VLHLKDLAENVSLLSATLAGSFVSVAAEGVKIDLAYSPKVRVHRIEKA
jgi:hypothetical protein